MRPNINEILMETALLYSKRSTCLRLQVGAVISLDNRIVSTGYNGSAHNHKHCKNHFKENYKKIEHTGIFKDFDTYIKSDIFKEVHGTWAKENELHAEMNAIMYCAKEGKSVNGGTIYTTISPCLSCAKAIIGAGIKKVFFNKLYDRPEGHKAIELLKSSGVEVFDPMEIQNKSYEEGYKDGYDETIEVISNKKVYTYGSDYQITRIDLKELFYNTKEKE